MGNNTSIKDIVAKAKGEHPKTDLKPPYYDEIKTLRLEDIPKIEESINLKETDEEGSSKPLEEEEHSKPLHLEEYQNKVIDGVKEQFHFQRREDSINLKETDEKEVSIGSVDNQEGSSKPLEEGEEFREAAIFKKIASHSKTYSKSEDYVKVKLNRQTAVKLKMLCSSFPVSQQGITAYLIEQFLEKAVVKKCLEKIKNDLD